MIGKTIKYMRKKNSFKQDVVAKQLNIKCNTLSQYETENRQVSFETVEKIAKICGYEIYFINKKMNDKIQVKDIERKDV